MVKEELGHITAGTHPEMSVIYSLNLQSITPLQCSTKERVLSLESETFHM